MDGCASRKDGLPEIYEVLVPIHSICSNVMAIEIGFNSRYLLDVLSVLESKTVKLGCKNSMSPTIIKSPDDESFLSVIMPLRVEW